ncbi:MAG: hypothetical protein GY795_27830 [Desulfobacterales bacterium]|nr:hypothetical protein [Desulfobacterales bacterium]
MKYLTKKILKGVAGGALLYIILINLVLFFDDQEYTDYANYLILIFISSFFILYLSGNIKKPLYLLIIPSMFLPLIIDWFILTNENYFGLHLMIIGAIISVKVINKYYSAKNKKSTSDDLKETGRE